MTVLPMGLATPASAPNVPADDTSAGSEAAFTAVMSTVVNEAADQDSGGTPSESTVDSDGEAEAPVAVDGELPANAVPLLGAVLGWVTAGAGQPDGAALPAPGAAPAISVAAPAAFHVDEATSTPLAAATVEPRSAAFTQASAAPQGPIADGTPVVDATTAPGATLGVAPQTPGATPGVSPFGDPTATPGAPAGQAPDPAVRPQLQAPGPLTATDDPPPAGGGAVTVSATVTAPEPERPISSIVDNKLATTAPDDASVTSADPRADSMTPLLTVPVATATRVDGPAPTSATAAATPAAQLVQHLAPLRREPDGVHRLTVHLNPAELGPIRVIAEVRGGDIAVHFAGATELGRDALKAALPDLRVQLTNAGFDSCALDLRREAPGQHGNGHGHAYGHTREQHRTHDPAAQLPGTGHRGRPDGTDTTEAPSRAGPDDRLLDLTL